MSLKYAKVIMHESKWAMRNGHSPEEIFRSLGAIDVNQIEKSNGYTRFMVTMPATPVCDGPLWHYAHTDGTSCYIAQEGYKASTAKVAWLMHENDIEMRSLENAEQTVKTLRASISARVRQIESAK
jgi:hypothetical protein